MNFRELKLQLELCCKYLNFVEDFLNFVEDFLNFVEDFLNFVANFLKLTEQKLLFY